MGSGMGSGMRSRKVDQLDTPNNLWVRLNLVMQMKPLPPSRFLPFQIFFFHYLICIFFHLEYTYELWGILGFWYENIWPLLINKVTVGDGAKNYSKISVVIYGPPLKEDVGNIFCQQAYSCHEFSCIGTLKLVHLILQRVSWI